MNWRFYHWLVNGLPAVSPAIIVTLLTLIILNTMLNNSFNSGQSVSSNSMLCCIRLHIKYVTYLYSYKKLHIFCPRIIYHVNLIFHTSKKPGQVSMVTSLASVQHPACSLGRFFYLLEFSCSLNTNSIARLSSEFTSQKKSIQLFFELHCTPLPVWNSGYTPMGEYIIELMIIKHVVMFQNYPNFPSSIHWYRISHYV